MYLQHKKKEKKKKKHYSLRRVPPECSAYTRPLKEVFLWVQLPRHSKVTKTMVQERANYHLSWTQTLASSM
jgi:hypothetical protein